MRIHLRRFSFFHADVSADFLKSQESEYMDGMNYVDYWTCPRYSQIVDFFHFFKNNPDIDLLADLVWKPANEQTIGYNNIKIMYYDLYMIVDDVTIVYYKIATGKDL